MRKSDALRLMLVLHYPECRLHKGVAVDSARLIRAMLEDARAHDAKPR